MTDNELAAAIEAILMVALEPVPESTFVELTEEPKVRVVEQLEAMRDAMEHPIRGARLVHTGSGWQLRTAAEQAEYVERFANRDVSVRLSTAALETLAIIAYRQPVSRAQISSLRGVNVDGVVRLLEQRDYIKEVGRADGPGQAILYGTTDLFLDRLAVATLEELPPIEEHLPEVDVVASLEAALSAKAAEAPATVDEDLDDEPAGEQPAASEAGSPEA